MTKLKNRRTLVSAGFKGKAFRLALHFALVFGAVSAFAPSQAAAETRSLKLHFIHTGERAEIPFKKNGRFLPEGLNKLNVFLRDWRRNEPTKMDPRLFDLVWQVNKMAGGRDHITVVSAYRSPATNSMLRSRSSGVAKTSQHMVGKAMDFYIPGVPLQRVRDAALKLQLGGVGYYPKSGSPFVHLDVGSIRHWPRMSRRELLAVFPDGKTIHVPTDGKPLPGYQQALAAIEARKSGGQILMASAAKPKSKSLFGRLFGGGADEAEDNAESTTTAVASASKRVAPKAAVVAAPVPANAPARDIAPEPVDTPQQTIMAALPARNIPMPLGAPRPEATIEAITQETTPAMQEALAFAVPVPVHRPQLSSQTALAMMAAPQQEPNIAPVNEADQKLVEKIAAEQQANSQLAMAEPAGSVLPGIIPVPAMRPAAAPVLIAAVPEMRPQRQDGVNARATDAPDMIAQLLDQEQEMAVSTPVPAPVKASDDAGQQVAMLTQDSVTTAATNVSGVRTTAKAGRADRSAAKPSAAAIVRPADAAPESVVSNQPVSRVVPVTNPVLRNDALRNAPTVVYTAGFQQELPSGDANRFTGNAVTFLSIAKFSKTN